MPPTSTVALFVAWLLGCLGAWLLGCFVALLLCCLVACRLLLCFVQLPLRNNTINVNADETHAWGPPHFLLVLRRTRANAMPPPIHCCLLLVACYDDEMICEHKQNSVCW